MLLATRTCLLNPSVGGRLPLAAVTCLMTCSFFLLGKRKLPYVLPSGRYSTHWDKRHSEAPRRTDGAYTYKNFPQAQQEGRSRLFEDTENTPAMFRPGFLELYTRLTYATSWNETRTALFPSLQLFWPQVSIAVCLDAEKPIDQRAAREMAKQVAEEFPPVKARGVVVADYPYLIGQRSKIKYTGYQRGQLDMFFADQVVPAKYVGLCDTDTTFVTLVTPQAIFSVEQKPIVRGMLSRTTEGTYDVVDRYDLVAVASAFMLQREYVMSCMSYFPVIISTKHLRQMRAYVEKIHRKPFVHVYRDMVALVRENYCQFSIMCNYIWHFHRDEYEFLYQNYHKFMSGWNDPRPNEIKNFSFLNEENTKPIIGVSVHLSYTKMEGSYDPPSGTALMNGGRVGHLRNRYAPEITSPMLANGFCYVSLAQCRRFEERLELQKGCSSIGASVDKLQVLLFRFELWQTWEWDDRVMDAQRSYYSSLQSYPYWVPYGRKIMSRFHSKQYTKLQSGHT